VVEQSRLKTIKLVLVWLCLIVSVGVHAEYKVSQQNASVTFSGEHAGMKFNGAFENWSADVALPDAQNQSGEAKIEAEFDLSSAKTGDMVYDETLPEGDWFDVKNHPTGSFVSNSITPSDNGYAVEGILTLRGKGVPSNFTLVKNNGRLVASVPINRIAYDIGLDSDPDAEWVSEIIELKIDIPDS
jgi:polyisoprenoid-binding protein YceI